MVLECLAKTESPYARVSPTAAMTPQNKYDTPVESENWTKDAATRRQAD